MATPRFQYEIVEAPAIVTAGGNVIELNHRDLPRTRYFEHLALVANTFVNRLYLTGRFGGHTYVLESWEMTT